MASDRVKSGQDLYDSEIQATYNNDGTFSIPGKPYKFNEKMCKCMDMVGHKPDTGCKHMNYFKIWIQHNKDPRKGEIESLQDKFKVIIDYMSKEGNAVNSETLYDKFGAELVDEAEHHHVIMTAGKMFVLLL